MSGGEDGAVCLLDLRVGRSVHRLVVADDGSAVPSLALHPRQPHTVFAACGNAVHTLDLRQAGSEGAPAVRRYEANSDEVNSVAVHARGTFLAAGDDSGVVQARTRLSLLAQQVVDLRTGEPYRALRGGHANICAAVAFRPHRPWELLSGGLDGALVRWDFSTGRPRRTWQMADDAGESTQVFNPPLVHAIAAGPMDAPRAIGRLVAAARGDGAVAVYDADAPADGGASPRRPRGRPEGGPAGRMANGHATGGAHAAQPPEGSGGSAASGQLGRLGAELGGHRAACSCACFLADGTGRRLVSGGNDRRVLLWDWAAAAPPGSEWATVADAGPGPGFQRAGGAGALLHVIEHGAKVNCVEAGAEGSCRAVVLVGGTQRRLAVYEVH